VLASFFNISVDRLLGYEPQMAAGDIRSLHLELLNDFAAKPFNDVMNRCREIVKKYASCFPLLFQMGLLFLGYGETAKDDEQKISTLAEAKELFARVKTLAKILN